jgi:DNA-binding GntR family transcriptional regulator
LNTTNFDSRPEFKMAMPAFRLAARRLTGQQPQAILRSALANEQTVLNRGSSPAYALRRRFTSTEASAANAPKISTEVRRFIQDIIKHDFGRLHIQSHVDPQVANLSILHWPASFCFRG